MRSKKAHPFKLAHPREDLGTLGHGPTHLSLLLLRGIFEGFAGAQAARALIAVAMEHDPEGQRLAAEYTFQVWTLRAPGYYGDDCLPSNHTYASDLMNALAGEDPDRLVISAESWGGGVLALCALLDTWRPSRLAVLSGAAWSDEIRISARFGAWTLLLPMMSKIAHLAYPYILARGLRKSPCDEVRSFALTLPDRTTTPFIAWLAYRAAARCLALEEADLGRIARQVVAIHATRDQAVHPRSGERLERRRHEVGWENVEVLRPRGLSHWATLEDPGLLVRVLASKLCGS